jgi:hypothetical protein
MVMQGERSLKEQSVLCLYAHIHHVDVDKELEHSHLKLKCRTNGLTYWKSEVDRPQERLNGTLRMKFGQHCGCICEGGLQFDLCESHVSGLRSSKTVARGTVPLTKVLSSSDQEQSHIMRFEEMELFSVDKPDKVLATLRIYLSFKKRKLEEVGGIKRLRSLKVPNVPQVNSLYHAIAGKGKALHFVRETEKAVGHLKSLLDGAMAPDEVDTSINDTTSNTTSNSQSLTTTMDCSDTASQGSSTASSKRLVFL